jgi:hypothetical protein
MTWIYQGTPLEEVPENKFGFVYLITHINTGRKYLGKKFFTKAGYKTVKGKRKKIRVESDWKTYYGSSDALQTLIEEHGHDAFTREILVLCETRSECAYYEAKFQFQHDVLLSDEWINDWISVRVTSRHMRAKKVDKLKNIV